MQHKPNRKSPFTAMFTWMLVFVFSCTNLIPVAAFAASEKIKSNSHGRNAPSPLAPLPPAGEGDDQRPAGKVRMESVQDKSAEDSKQTNVGGRVQVSFGTAWDASGSVSQSKGSGSSTAVNQQSGLFAADGGYHVKADAVDLKGGAIVSTNASNSDLTANTLTTSNLQNKMNYAASSVSLAGGISGQSSNSNGSSTSGIQQQNFGDTKSGNVTPGLPMLDKGGASSTTYATLTDGNITIGGKTTASVKDLGINTDAAKAHTSIAAIPDIKVLLKDQQAMSAAAGTVIATSKQIAGDIAAHAGKALDAAQKVINDPNSSADQIAQAKLSLIDAKQTQTDWGTGGDNSRALAVVTGILVGGVAGQGATQLAANASAPYAAAAIGDYFKTPGNENQTLQNLSHAILGATLAYANGSSAVGGAVAGGGAELAAQVLTKQLYPDAFDANGQLIRDKLTAAQANNITALSSGIGALLSGVAGGSVLDAAVGGKIATNAVENNYLKQTRDAFNKPSEQEKLNAAVAGCAKGNQADCNTKNALIGLSQARDRGVTVACSGGPSSDCHDLVRLAQDAGNKVIFGNDGKAYIYPIGTPELVAIPSGKDGSFHDQVSKSTSEALLLDIGGGATELLVGGATKAVRWIGYGTTDAAKIFDGGSVVANAVTPGVESVWHSTRTTGAASGILNNGIDPAFLNTNSRFGSAFYVAEQPATSLAEMAHYGVEPTTGIRFSVNQGSMKVLDLTNPDTAVAWGYKGGSISSTTQQIGTDALAQGYNAIRYVSERAAGGTNLAILNDFNQILKPVMVTPVKP